MPIQTKRATITLVPAEPEEKLTDIMTHGELVFRTELLPYKMETEPLHAYVHFGKAENGKEREC